MGGDQPVTGLSITFDDDVEAIPDDGPLEAGTFRPTSIDPLGFRDKNGRAPSPRHGTALSVFDGRDPNGTWELYVLDPSSGAAGAITEGGTVDLELDEARPATATSGDGETGEPEQPMGSPGTEVFANDAPIEIPPGAPATTYLSTSRLSKGSSATST